eukprot:1804077-Rhodomonas_salina.1
MSHVTAHFANPRGSAPFFAHLVDPLHGWGPDTGASACSFFNREMIPTWYRPRTLSVPPSTRRTIIRVPEKPGCYAY